MKEDIKRRSEMTDYLQSIFINEAIGSFIKSKSFVLPINNVLYKRYYDNLAYFSRMWLNYLPKDFFDDFLVKKLKEEIFLKRNNDSNFL